MTYQRPDIQTLIRRAESDIEARLPGADARTRRSNLNVLARILAGAAHGLYGYMDWIARQIIIDTAEAELLERHASVWGVYRLPASPASGTITLTGVPGASVPAETVFRRADGTEYATNADAGLAAGTTATIGVTAIEAGQAGNAAAGTALSIDTPIAGINAGAAADTGITGGADAETDDSLRARLLARIRMPPMGGAAHDYIAWAREVPGVTRAWCYPLEMGDGTVTVRFTRDNDANPIPDAAEAATVQDYIDARRPVTAHVYVVAPIPAPIDFTVSVQPDTPAVRAAVEAEIRDVLIREAEPEGGAGEGRIRVSHLREAISLAAGEVDHVLVSPAENIALSLGQMAVFGSVSWV